MLLIIIFVVGLPFLVDLYVGSFGDDKLYRGIEDIPHKRAALVLGTAKYFEGRNNLYYEYRLDAAAQLWHAGKIDAIVVSGDNSRKDYDEPSNMKTDLVDRAVPSQYITIDYAGFRTLDSVIRAKKIFDLKDYIIVSQPFHCCRAIYLARKHGQKVIGYCARDLGGSVGFKNRLRESLARTKAVFDVIVSKRPKYFGKKETVNYRSDKAQQYKMGKYD